MIDTQVYKARLEEEKGNLEGELETVGRRNPSNPNDWEAAPDQQNGGEPDPNDVATDLQNYGDNAAVLNDLELRYNDVLGALARIEDGSYGKCTVGGEEIEIGRLEADPTASTCIAHKG